MKQDMKTILTRLFTVIMLMMISMGVEAQVKIDLGGEKNDGIYTGGTIKEKGQTKPDDNGLVTVTITVTPNKGYTISSKDITVVSTVRPAGSNAGTRTPTIAAILNPIEKDPVDLSQPRDYSYIVSSTLGVWVKEANFKDDGSKGDRGTGITSLSDIGTTGDYVIEKDIDASDFTTSIETFSGTLTAQPKADGTFPVISGLTKPIFATATNATISNIMLKSVSISQNGYVGAIACTANGTTRIYNCGILPTTARHEATGRSTVASINNHCGSLVGFLDGYARVINCFSYANVSAPADNNKVAGGLVGYNNYYNSSNKNSTQQGNSETNFNNNCKTMVVNCMFYGDIPQAHIKRPVYGGNAYANNAEHKVNNYNYFCEDEASYATYDNISKYNYSWPVAKKYLQRFEVYRNILNSNRRLCTWWVNGAYNTCPTDVDVETVGIAKWVLDLSIAPYPILKKWGKYPSVINQDEAKRVDPSTKAWDNRGNASGNWGKHTVPDTEGQILGSIVVSIDAGDHHSGSDSRTINITAMDTEYKDYCYGKIQLPYYNEIFGNPNGTTWSSKYGDNYGEYVVTGWEITSTNGSDAEGHTFLADWQDGYNFADRKCVSKDLYGTSGRVFAQGGYYYVPDGVTAISIKAHWGKAVYLCNTNSRLDRVNNANNDFYNAGTLSFGSTSGILPLWPSSNNLKATLSDAVGDLTIQPTKSVYDQAIVLVSNYQNNAFHSNITLSGSDYDSKAKPFTIMSADFDFDNEPDFCFQAGMNNGGRINCQPIRFDFLFLPDLTMAIRTGTNYWGMRIFTPQGHFEITETSYMYITQFEYDMRPGTDNGYKIYMKHEAPMILNGGEFMQMVSSENRGTGYNETAKGNTATWQLDRTSYFIMGGNLYMKAFTPGTHGNRRLSTRHCAVNAIGGEYPEFYLSGMFNADFYNKTDNPHCYIDGGKFGIIAGAGMESVGGKNETNGGNVTFKINHSLINEFYGGGINANRPVTGNISVTCDNSKVTKYCGGPKVGDMSNTKTIQTNATGSTFDEFYGGGNGGTNNERVRIYDSNGAVPAPTEENASTQWGTLTESNKTVNYGFDDFLPFRYVNGGYETEFEFELLPDTRGTSNVVKRTYHYIATFSKTTVAPVTNTITDCTFNGNFYGGGNLGAVGGDVTSTLKSNTIVHGSAFGAGFSASATSFKVHDESTVVYPYRDKSGFIHDGSLQYAPTEYTWINDIPSEWNITPVPSTSNPTFSYGGKTYCYTTTSMDGLGTVTGDVTLNIEDNTLVLGKIVNKSTDNEGNVTISYGEQTGGVFGGGDASGVNGDVVVKIDAAGQQEGYDYNTYRVFGGGNKAKVEGNATVNLFNGVINDDVFGGGNEAEVTGNVVVNIKDGDD